MCECKCRSVSVQEIFRKNPSQCFREKEEGLQDGAQEAIQRSVREDRPGQESKDQEKGGKDRQEGHEKERKRKLELGQRRGEWRRGRTLRCSSFRTGRSSRSFVKRGEQTVVAGDGRGGRWRSGHERHRGPLLSASPQGQDDGRDVKGGLEFVHNC